MCRSREGSGSYRLEARTLAPYAFALAFFVGAVGGLVRWPLLALGAYMLTYYAHPPSRWWGVMLPDLRWSLSAAVCAVLAAYFYKSPRNVHGKSWYQDGIIYCLLLFVGWMWIQTPWAAGFADHLEGTILMTKYFVIIYVLVKLLDSPDALDFMCIVHIIGCAYFGVLARESGSGGERLDGVGGPDVNDANTLGMQLATAAVLGAVQVLSGPLWKRGLVVICMPFILNGLVLTQSRGAFLGLAAGGCALFFLAPKGRRSIIGFMGAAGVVLFLALASQTFWERMQTIQVVEGQEREKSAESRLIIASAQLKMFAANPMGIGHRGTAALSRQYIPEEYLAKEEGVAEENRQRSSHNTSLSILVEQGIVGAVIYIMLIRLAFKRVLSLRSGDSTDAERARISMLAAGIGGSLVVVLVAGQFADYLRKEVLVWIYAMIVAATRVMQTYTRSLEKDAPIQTVAPSRTAMALRRFARTAR